MPHTASATNPVDLTFTRNPIDYFSKIPEILLKDPETDSLIVYFLASENMIKRVLEGMGISADETDAHAEKIINQQCDAIAEIAEKNGKPFVGFSFLTRESSFIRGLQDRGVPVLAGPERAAKAMGALVKYMYLRKKISAD
jgi:acetyl-CoA synthetase (ADP-forming)